MKPLQPAVLELRDDGTPFSNQYGDVYHTRAGGPAQAEQVFLHGNDLPRRWCSCKRFVIVETGFGLGVNFLATWAAWQRHAPADARLHFISTELHPFSAADLRHVYQQWPQWRELATELVHNWPQLTPGMHRLHLDHGRVVLTLLLGDARDLLPQLWCRADAFYLDGFAPAKNPELWNEALLFELRRLAAPGATLATWSVSGTVRRALTAAGFTWEKSPGFADKREKLRACFMGPAAKSPPIPPRRNHAVVIGAGLAGSAMAHRLAERGWYVEVLEAGGTPGEGASGNLTGVLRPLPSLDDNPMARLSRAGTLYAQHHIRRLTAAGLSVKWDDCGVLHLARDAEQAQRMQAVVRRHNYPRDYLQFVTNEQASQIAQWPVEYGGWWFPRSGWVNPPSLCEANLAAHPQHIRTRFNCRVTQLQRDAGEWILLSADKGLITRAPVVVLACGAHVRSLAQAEPLAVRVARGQVTHLRHEAGPAVVVCRGGYVSPVVDGVLSVGASFDIDDEDLRLRATDHQANLKKLNAMLPGHPGVASPAPAALHGRTGLRPASPDRLPLIGPVPERCRASTADTLESLPYQPDLYALAGYGARGLVWSALAAEALTCHITGEPLPLENDLMQAIAPGRYVLRNARKRGGQP